MTQPLAPAAVVAQMETALKKQGHSVAELCRRAEIAETTWQRWKKGPADGGYEPRGKTWRAALAAYDELTKPKEGAAA